MPSMVKYWIVVTVDGWLNTTAASSEAAAHTLLCQRFQSPRAALVLLVPLALRRLDPQESEAGSTPAVHGGGTEAPNLRRARCRLQHEPGAVAQDRAQGGAPVTASTRGRPPARLTTVKEREEART